MQRHRRSAARLIPLALVLLALLLAGCPERTETSHPAPPPDPPPEQEVMSLTVHFSLDEQPVPLERHVAATETPLRAALDAQLQGPTDAERADGYFSWFSERTAGMINSVASDDGHAVVDFQDFSAIIPNASASAGSAILLGELNATVFQFPSVRSVEYRFDGSCDDFFEWLQAACQRIQRPQG